MDICWDAAPIVAHRNRVVRVQCDGDMIGMTGQGFVDAVVDHLIDHMMQARAVIGVADIHARPFPDRFQAFENFD